MDTVTLPREVAKSLLMEMKLALGTTKDAIIELTADRCQGNEVDARLLAAANQTAHEQQALIAALEKSLCGKPNNKATH
jgi:hypothetical protein